MGIISQQTKAYLNVPTHLISILNHQIKPDAECPEMLYGCCSYAKNGNKFEKRKLIGKLFSVSPKSF